jgi:hypothetical protein
MVTKLIYVGFENDNIINDPEQYFDLSAMENDEKSIFISWIKRAGKVENTYNGYKNIHFDILSNIIKSHNLMYTPWIKYKFINNSFLTAPYPNPLQLMSVEYLDIEYTPEFFIRLCKQYILEWKKAHNLDPSSNLHILSYVLPNTIYSLFFRQYILKRFPNFSVAGHDE